MAQKTVKPVESQDMLKSLQADKQYSDINDISVVDSSKDLHAVKPQTNQVREISIAD